MSTRKKVWRSHPFSNPSHADFSPDGSRIAVKSTSGQIVILDRSSGEVISDFENQSEGEGSNVRFSASGEQLIDGSWDGLITVRAVSSGEILAQLEFAGEMIVRVHRDLAEESWISLHSPKATVDDQPPANDYFLRWASICKGSPKRLKLDFPFISSTALSLSGSRFAVAFGAPPTAMVNIDLKSQKVIWTSDVQLGGSTGHICWAPNDSCLGAVQDGRIALYGPDGGELLGFHDVQYPSDVDFSPDGLLVAFGAWQDGVIASTAEYAGRYPAANLQR